MVFTKCKRCGKTLKDSVSQKIGYGKTCYKKMCKEKNHFKKLYKEVMNDDKRRNTKSD